MRFRHYMGCFLPLSMDGKSSCAKFANFFLDTPEKSDTIKLTTDSGRKKMSSLPYSLESLQLIITFVKVNFPLVERELSVWRRYAEQIPCPELSAQALASIRDKTFHCQGGSIYGLYHQVDTPSFLRLVVALQTISDYLDNLCDRGGVADEKAFACLHLAMTDAFEPQTKPRDYYAQYPFTQDGGYLRALVETCRQEIKKLPSYAAVKPHLMELAQLYSQLQTYKHAALPERQEKMLTWLTPLCSAESEITPWEYAAATGSTLGMFALCAAASRPGLTPAEADALNRAYFPWISGLHILLDYFIDRQEDQVNGDLNFLSYYKDEAQAKERLLFFLRHAYAACQQTPSPFFNRSVIDGLLAMYLSDPKTKAPLEAPIKKALLQSAGWYARCLHNVCKLLRWRQIL